MQRVLSLQEATDALTLGPGGPSINELLALHARVFGPARMEGNDPPVPPVEKTFTQAEVNALTAREKDQAERKARADLLTSLGLDPDTVKPEDVKKTLEEAAAARRATESDLERRQRELDERDAATKAREADIAQRNHNAGVERYLLAAGLAQGETDETKKRDAIDRAAGYLRLNVGADDATIKVAVDALKGDMPVLFGGAAQQPGGGTGTGQQGSGQQGGGTGKSLQERGREKALELGWMKPEGKTA